MISYKVTAEIPAPIESEVIPLTTTEWLDPMNALGKEYQLAGVGVVFVCASYNDRLGYRMVPKAGRESSRYVSEHAINRTFHEVVR